MVPATGVLLPALTRALLGRGKNVVPDPGYAPGSPVLQTGAVTSSADQAYWSG